MDRVVVIGAAGSGKTTLARRIAVLAGVPHIDFDPFYWRPGWMPAERSLLIHDVQEATDAPAWIASGNYLD